MPLCKAVVIVCSALTLTGCISIAEHERLLAKAIERERLRIEQAAQDYESRLRTARADLGRSAERYAMLISAAKRFADDDPCLTFTVNEVTGDARFDHDLVCRRSLAATS